jgi:hypothetical protein
MLHHIYWSVFSIGTAYILCKLFFTAETTKPIGKSSLDTLFERFEEKVKSLVSKKKFK